MTATPAEAPTKRLTGKGLVGKVKELTAEGLSRSEIAIECGYYVVVKGGPRDGSVRASTMQLQQALLEAQGFNLLETTPRATGTNANRVVVSERRCTATLVKELLEQIPDVGPGSVFIPTVDPEEGTILLSLADDE